MVGSNISFKYDKKNIESILEYLITKNKFNEKKWNDPDPIVFSIKQYLYNSIDFGVEISETTKIKIIDKCIFEISGNLNLSNEFKNLLNIELKNLIKRTKKYQIVFLIYTNHKFFDKLIPTKIVNIKIDYFDINNCEFKDHLYKQFWFYKDQFSPGIFLSIDDKNIAIPNSNFIQLHLNIRNYDSNSAIVESLRIIDLFRFCINFPYSQSLIRSTGIGYRTISDFQQSPLYILIDKNNKGVDPIIYSNSQKYKYNTGGSLTIGDFNKHVGYYNKLINEFSKSTDSYFFFSFCQTYQNALDQIDPNLIYLYFWQTLEILTLYKKEPSDIKIKSRIKNLLNLNQKDLLFTTIDSIDAPRHNFVHSGIDVPITTISIFNIKSITEECIKSIFNLFNKKIISNCCDLEYFYKNYSRNDRDLEQEKNNSERKKVIEYIQNLRKPRSLLKSNLIKTKIQ